MPDRLKELREIKHFSQGKLAEVSGVSQSVITKAEQAHSVPNGEVLEKLATALDCTIDYLFGRWDEYASPSAAAAQMSFAVFAKKRTVPNEQLERCRRVLEHASAPKTAADWQALTEMLEMSIGPAPAPSTKLAVMARSTQSNIKPS
jgi:transcriptional regulator with XRE-family HTH domain